MESDLSKLFIGGISWDTDENRLKEYFGQYGEVVEALIMRDRVTGRARGFGFIVFADPAVAERVVKDEHMIDGRTVEAKQAVPREDHHLPVRNNNGIPGSACTGPTKKIFVGGLASTVKEADFKMYFDQFGNITDVAVMYDHNTRRPRGFGFITYDSEDAVGRVLHKTFHELHGKMVEVKCAIPKELSLGPNRSPLVGYSCGSSRDNNFINSYRQGYNLSTVSGYGRFIPLAMGRSGFPSLGTPAYGPGMSMEPGLSYGGKSSFTNSIGDGRVLNSYYNGNLNRYNTPIGYNRGNIRTSSLLTSEARNVRGNEASNDATVAGPGTLLGSVNGNFGVSFENRGSKWGSPSITSQGGGRNLSFGFGQNNDTSTLMASTIGSDSSYGDLYHGGSVYSDSTRRSSSSDMEVSGSFAFGFGNASSNVNSETIEGFTRSYDITNRKTTRGITASETRYLNVKW